MTDEVWLILCGFAAGMVNGFLGSGGGIIIILSLILLRKHKKIPQGEASNDFPTAIAAILPMSLVSLARYADSGHVDWRFALILSLPAALGGLIGALLLDKIKLDLVRKIFAALIVISGVIMIVKV